jgi:predicted nucleic acid-binding protein
MSDEAVSNSGPLIHLAQINKFDLFSIFDKIYIPAQVYLEVSAFDALLKRKIDKAENIKKMEVVPLSPGKLTKKLAGYNLDSGELQAISLCYALGKNLFLTDDLDAREAALACGLNPHGSVGIIVSAYRRKYLDLETAEKAMYDLYEISNLFITRSIINLGIEELRKCQ